MWTKVGSYDVEGIYSPETMDLLLAGEINSYNGFIQLECRQVSGSSILVPACRNVREAILL